VAVQGVIGTDIKTVGGVDISLGAKTAGASFSSSACYRHSSWHNGRSAKNSILCIFP